MRPNPRCFSAVLLLGAIWTGLLPVSPLYAQQPQLRLTLRGDAGPVTAVAFSPDGKTLASGYMGWRDIDRAKRPGKVDNSVGRVLDREVQLWDVQTGQRTVSFGGRTGFMYSDPVFSVAFSRDGKALASGSADKTITLWDVRTGQVRTTLKGHTHWVTFVAYGLDGKTLASGSTDGTARLWDVTTGKNTATLGGDTAIYPFGFPVAFSPDGKNLAAGRNKITGFKSDEIQLWDTPTRTERVRIRHDDTVTSLAFSPDGKTLASGRGDGSIKLWDVQNGKDTATIATQQPSGVAFSPDGTTVATWGGDRTVGLWNVTTGKRTATLQSDCSIYAVTFSPDGTALAAGGSDGAVYLWDMRAPERDGQE